MIRKQKLYKSEEDVQKDPQCKSIAYQWHQEEEQTNHDKQHTCHKYIQLTLVISISLISNNRLSRSEIQVPV